MNERAEKAAVDIEKINSRIMTGKFQCKGADLTIICHHAPQSECKGGVPEKQRHWNHVEKIAQNISKEKVVMIVGDTNARLHGRKNELEEAVIGNHCFAENRSLIDAQKETEAENREELVDFCIKNGFVVSNTYSGSHPAKSVHIAR